MKKLLKYGVPVILGIVLLGVSFTAQAQFAINKINKGGLPESENINENIVRIVQWFLALVAIIALVVIVWAGVTYMTAGGDEDKITKAKTRLTYGILGIVVALAGLVIMWAIHNVLSNNYETGNLTL